MTYGRMLERRSSGIYYYRQTLKNEGKQVVRRFSLKTRDLELAKFLSLQIRARVTMIDFDRIGKFEAQFGPNGQLQSVKTTE